MNNAICMWGKSMHVLLKFSFTVNTPLLWSQFIFIDYQQLCKMAKLKPTQ